MIFGRPAFFTTTNLVTGISFCACGIDSTFAQANSGIITYSSDKNLTQLAANGKNIEGTFTQANSDINIGSPEYEGKYNDSAFATLKSGQAKGDIEPCEQRGIEQKKLVKASKS